MERLSFGPPAEAPQAATSPPHVPQEPRSLLAAVGDPESPLPAALARDDPRKATPFTTRLLPKPKKARPP